MGIKVVKFGGSSVADAIQVNKIKDIVEKDPDRKIVVVSAPGKRFDQDSKITDLLLSCMLLSQRNLPYEQLFQVVCDRFTATAMGLDKEIAGELEEEFQLIKEVLDEGQNKDYIVSRGEYLSAKIIGRYMGYDFVDAKDVIKFDERGKLLVEDTNEALRKELHNHEKCIIPGFYGSKPDGTIKTFSRGGSDITGALVAKAIGADMYENWTDVSGFLMADPRIIENPKPIKRISYKELRELSYMGASVLHEEAIYPARTANIPINIKNTNRPDDEGTIITNEPDIMDKRVVSGIAGSKDFTVIGIYKDMLASERGFVRRLAGILEDYDISLEHMPSGIDTLSVVVSKKDIGDRLDDILEEFDRQLQPDALEVLEDIALIATVGVGMSYRPGVSAKLFTALADAGVNIRMIDQGSTEMNIIVGVENNQMEKSIRAIYKAFVEEER